MIYHSWPTSWAGQLAVGDSVGQGLGPICLQSSLPSSILGHSVLWWSVSWESFFPLLNHLYLDPWVFSHISLCDSLPYPPEGVGEQQDRGITCQPGPPCATSKGTAICREARWEHRQSKRPQLHRPCTLPLLVLGWWHRVWLAGSNEWERSLRGSWAWQRAGRKQNWSTWNEHVSWVTQDVIVVHIGLCPNCYCFFEIQRHGWKLT